MKQKPKRRKRKHIAATVKRVEHLPRSIGNPHGTSLSDWKHAVLQGPA